MKFSSIALFTTAALSSSTVQSFTILPNAVKSVTPISRSMFYAEETDEKNDSNDFGSKMPTVYERLGFEEDKIAIGIQPNEVLQWLGNRDDIAAKFTEDNKGMEPERVQLEVDKFMMDREMVEVFIAYEKRKADPRNLKAEAEANLSDPSTWGTYAIWITGGAGFAYIKNVIIEPKYRSGEWEEIHIPLPGAGMFGQNAADAALQSADTVSSVVDAASSAM